MPTASKWQWNSWFFSFNRFTRQGCHPTRIWTIIRHGTRNPSESVILQAQNRLSEIKKRILDQTKPPICTAELEKLRQWHWMHLNATEDEKLLVAEGEDELIELAERMQRRFPDLLPELYNPEWYYFKYTATQRTLKSAESFATGLFGRHRIHTVRYPPPLHEDPVLRVSSPLVFSVNVTKTNFWITRYNWACNDLATPFITARPFRC